MDRETKKLYDRLVNAEWIDNVRDTQSKEQKGIRIHELALRKIEDPKEYGYFKLVTFSKLYRELSKSGPISTDELKMIVTLGHMFALQRGFEKL